MLLGTKEEDDVNHQFMTQYFITLTSYEFTKFILC